MIEQITSTYVGVVGMIGFLLCVFVGFGIYAWFVKEVKDSDGDTD